MKKIQILVCFLLVLSAVVLSGCFGSGDRAASASLPAPPPQSSTTESEPVTTLDPEPAAPPETEAATPPESEPAALPEAEPEPELEPTPSVPDAPADPPAQAPSEEPEATFVYHETIPILMYHEVNDLLANSLYLSVADFTAHLEYFEQAGITPISMQQLYDHWFNEAPLPEKPIVLSFDDGYRTMYTTVYPLLKERGWSGTFYCITSTFENEGHLTQEMIAEMAAGGMEIGSHTVSHLELNSLGNERLNRELNESREILANLTGQEINMLCYPAGRYNDATKLAASDAGYLCGVTTQYGFARKSQGMFDLKRIRVSTDCGAAWMKDVLSPLGY